MWLIILIAGFVCFDMIGYIVHRLMHSRWTGALYSAHQKHHKLYSKQQESEVYLTVDGDNSPLHFTIVVIGLIVLMFTIFSPHLAALLAVELVIFALLNGYIHDAMHTSKHRFNRFSWFWRLKSLHRTHHRNQKRNFGIYSFLADHVFGTYKLRQN